MAGGLNLYGCQTIIEMAILELNNDVNIIKAGFAQEGIFFTLHLFA